MGIIFSFSIIFLPYLMNIYKKSISFANEFNLLISNRQTVNGTEEQIMLTICFFI